MAKLLNLPNDSVHAFIEELGSRIVAESGKSRDRFHLGKILLQSLKDDPDFVVQIDGATGEAMTSVKLLEKTVRCAVAIRNFGLQIGDVIVLMAPNHLGVIISGVNINLTVDELQDTFVQNRPKMVFCQSEKVRDIQAALKALQLDSHIITFDAGESFCSYADFLCQYSDNSSIEDFKPNEFDPEKTIACVTPTGGTTGLSKACASTHKNFATNVPYLWAKFSTFPSPTRMVFVQPTLNAMSAIVNFILPPIVRVTRLQTSQAVDRKHACYFINNYREVTPNTDVMIVYGMTELSGAAFQPSSSLPASCIGRPFGHFQYRIVDIETNKDIFEPNIPGELWIKGTGVFKEYYNNPEVTKAALTEDRWLKTGDMVYRDQQWNFFYVGRVKLMLRYKNIKIVPAELENVIRQHRGVEEVVVTGVPDPEHGDAPVACVVRQPDSDVTAQHIMDYVKEILPPIKHLVGVVFVDEIPMSAASKVNRQKLKEIALAL